MAAEEIHKHTKNAPGRYYVVWEHCLDHGICAHLASGNFRVDDELPAAYVYKQPSTPEEEEECRQAMDGCPMAAIRDDGDKVFVPLLKDTNPNVEGS
ncbi:MAG TPA: ferredoxin [Blastocatellia bacterium]|nr:ferredoxin [Blastocatellia bacterium]